MAVAILDVHYPAAGAVAACVVLPGWGAAASLEERTASLPTVAPYVPGRFFERELPCLWAVLSHVESEVTAAVVDGYVWLDRAGRPGLGARLFESLGGKTPVVGVAKTRFGPPETSAAVEVLRGRSGRPLFVTAAGMSAADAAPLVRSMSGGARIPWALARVDALCRGR